MAKVLKFSCFTSAFSSVICIRIVEFERSVIKDWHIFARLRVDFAIFEYYFIWMRRLIYLIGLSFLATHCTPEFVPDSMLDDESNAIIVPTGDPNGRTGEVEASFLSSQNKFTFSESTMMSSQTFRVSYVSTSQNFDIFKWVFEGGQPTSDSASSTQVSGTTIIEGSLGDPEVAVLIEYDGFGRYDMTHAVANSTSLDVVSIKDFVTYEYLDDLQVKTNGGNTTASTTWDNEQQGWFSPSAGSTVTYTPCPNAMVGYYQSDLGAEDEPAVISKAFSNFGNSPKNLVFEYKFEFLVLPNSPDSTKKISLGYTPLFPGNATVTIEPGELWSDSTYDVTEFRQVVVPLPLISDFRLSFTKYPSILNSNGIQRYPFSVCIRNLKIVPGN